MTPSVFPGGWYCDALPTGEFVVLVPHVHLLTHRGVIPLPPGETFGPLFVRCTNVGNFRFAGQAHDSIEPACWEWIDGFGWKSYPQPCVGVSPVIYDQHGVLHRSDGSVGSQGYRYVNDANQIVSGDATYGPFHGLFEYTQLAPDLWIGQAAYDGGGVQVLQREPSAVASIFDTWTLRQLELGDGRFVRANFVGERVAIAWMQSVGSVIVWTTLRELRALSPVTVAPPPPPPPPPEVPMSLSIVQRVRAKYPTPLGARHWEFLVDVAQQTGTLLFHKDGGTHIFVPPLGKNVSQDIVGRGVLGDVWVDILGDAEGQAIPTWDAHPNAGGEYLDVSGIELPGNPPPPPPPVDPPPPDVNARLTALEGAVLRIRTALHGV